MSGEDFKIRVKHLLRLKKAGAMKKFPFNPKKDVGLVERTDVGNWQKGGAKEERARIPAMSGHARVRALHRLGAQTKSRRNPNTGEREFLLHRGASKDEISKWVRHGYALHDTHTSWTPHFGSAEHFSMHYSKPSPDAPTDAGSPSHIISAWIPESQIHHIPQQLGALPGGGPSYFRNEYEVVVKPNHGSMVAHPKDLEDLKGDNTLEGRLSREFKLKKTETGPTFQMGQIDNSTLKRTVDDLFDKHEGSTKLGYSRTEVGEIEGKLKSLLTHPEVNDDVKKYAIGKVNQKSLTSLPGLLRHTVESSIFGKNAKPSEDLIRHAIGPDGYAKNMGSSIFSYHKVPLDIAEHNLTYPNQPEQHIRDQALEHIYKHHYNNTQDPDPKVKEILARHLGNASSHTVKKILSQKNVNPEIFNWIGKDGDFNHKFGHIADMIFGHKDMPQDIIEHHVNHRDQTYPFNSTFSAAMRNVKDPKIIERHMDDQHLSYILDNPYVPQHLIQRLIDTTDNKGLSKIAKAKALNTQNLHDLADRVLRQEPTGVTNSYDKNNTLRQIAEHPKADHSLVKKIMGQLSGESTKRFAPILAHHDPDEYSSFYEKGEPSDAPSQRSVNVHPDIDKLNRIKFHLMEIGTPTVRKSELEKRGIHNIPAAIISPKGTVDLASLEKYKGTLENDRYNLSYGTWNVRSTDPKGVGEGWYPQMHDLTKNQMVVRVNPSTKQIEEIKSKGLYDTYKSIQDLVRYGGSTHPIGSNSLGWARIDNKSRPGHWHIDEIQTDIPDIVNTIKKYQSGGQYVDNSTVQKLLEKADPKRVDEVMAILAGKHHDLEHVIHSAVHELGRQNNIESVSMDSSEDQAKQASLKSDRALPSKHKKIYEERPKKVGYEERSKEEIFGKAPTTRTIEGHVEDMFPSDEVDDEGRPVVYPDWMEQVKERQWGPENKIQFMKLIKSYMQVQQRLAKGAVRRIYGKFLPELSVVAGARDWHESELPEIRAKLARRKPGKAEKARMFNKLAAATKMRKNPLNGKREFLLHRGGSPREIFATSSHSTVSYDQPSSWTPYYNVAHEFSIKNQDEGHDYQDSDNMVHSAWISEDHIKTIPGQFTGHSDLDFGNEHEVIIAPHTSAKATGHEVHMARYEPKTLKQQIRMRLKKSADEAAVKVDNENPKSPRIATYNLFTKGRDFKTEKLDNGLYHHHLSRGGITYHVLSNIPDYGKLGTHQNVLAAAAVGHHADSKSLLDLAVSTSGEGYGKAMVDTIKSFHKDPTLALARARATDHAEEGWEDHHPDLYDNLIVGYPSDHADKGISGATMNGKKLGDVSVVVKPSMLGTPFMRDLTSYGDKHFSDPRFTPAHREAMFHYLADRFFNLGKYVPRTAVFKHPFTEDPHSAQEFIKNAKPWRDDAQLDGVKSPEDLYKLGLMDSILGNRDRHKGNVMFSGSGDIRLIDNGLSFDYGNLLSIPTPMYVEPLFDKKVPESVHEWVKGLDPEMFKKLMEKRGVPEPLQETAIAKLLATKQWASDKSKKREDLWEALKKMSFVFFNPKEKSEVVDKIEDMVDDARTVKEKTR